MLSVRHNDAVLVWAPAKVNLFLEVLAKRSDGYHEIATLMVAVSLTDTLEFKEDPSGEIQLSCDQPDLATGPENLIVRAATLLRERTGRKRGVTIRLAKRIPVAAGLAGGSTDAAATLAGLNELWQLGLESSELARLAGEIGSDVAFFFATPAAWCTGRGEMVVPLAVPRPLWFVLLCPPFGISTADVYRGVTVPERPQTGDEIRRAVVDGDVAETGRRLHNRLQPVAETLCPAVAAYQARLAEFKTAGYLMSGSGSSLFALCRDYREAQALAGGLLDRPEERMNSRVFIVRSCS
jgi:4-diphosphocytidyl-2-C-methyl-D-erythritol kinase